MKGFLIFSIDDKDDVNDEDINSLFVLVGVEEGNIVSVDVEDNFEFLKWDLNIGCFVFCIVVSVVFFFCFKFLLKLVLWNGWL